MTERYKPHVTVRIIVSTQSSRHGSKIDLLTVHDTEGANIPNSVKDLIGLGNYFDSTLNTPQASSSQVAVDGDGFSARYVPDEMKAWHCAFYNAVSLGIELLGFASQHGWPDAQVHEAARWLAYWSYHHDVPLQKGAVSRDGRVLRRGVVRHSDLGVLGGGHRDPGTFPLAECLVIARRYRKMY